MRAPVYPGIRYHKTLEPKSAKSAEHDADLKKLGYDRHAVIFSEIKEDAAKGDGTPEQSSAPAVAGKRKGRNV